MNQDKGEHADETRTPFVSLFWNNRQLKTEWKGMMQFMSVLTGR